MLLKRIAIAFGGILLLSVTVLLVAPSFIDWTNYRTAFETQLANATGRTVEIQGDVSLTLLPRPALQVSGVRIANLAGASSPDFARAEQVSVNLAFGPLLGGRLQFTSIEIIEPVFHMEVMEDGSATWDLRARRSNTAAGGAASTRAPFDLGVDALVIVNGSVDYRDTGRGLEQDFTNLNVELAAGSTSGPFDAVGEVAAFGVLWQIDLSVGLLRRNRPSALVVVLTNEEAGISVDITGSVTQTDTAPVIAGRLSVFGDSGVNSLTALGFVSDEQTVPLEVGESYRLESRFEATGTSFRTEALSIRLGATTAQGSGMISWRDDPVFDLNLSLSRLNLEAWKFAAIPAPTRYAEGSRFSPVTKVHAQSPANERNIPGALRGSFTLDIGLIEWRGQVMRNGQLSVVLNDSMFSIERWRIFLPGSAQVTLSGTIDAKNETPEFNLAGRASSRDLRSMLDWLDLAPSPGAVPPSRLNSFSVTSDVTGTPDRLVFDNIQLTLDTTTIEGSLHVNPFSPPVMSMDLSASSFDLDSYLPALNEYLGLRGVAAGQVSYETETLENDQTGANSFLANLDTDIDLTIGTLTAQQNVFHNVQFSGKAEENSFLIDDLNVEDMAGARLSMTGRVIEIGSRPRAEDLKIAFSSDDFARLDRTLGLDLPSLDLLTGPVSLDATISGTLDQSTFDASASLSGLSIAGAGTAMSLPGSPEIDATVNVSHDDYRAALSVLGAVEAEQSSPTGPFNMSATIKGSSTKVQLENLQAEIGGNGLVGHITYEMSGERPSLTGKIEVATFDVDALIPPDPTQQFARASLGRTSTSSDAISRRWSVDPIDLSFLTTFDAALDVTAERLLARGFDIDQFNAQVFLSDGKLSVMDWQGNLYGGPSNGDFTMTVGPSLNIETRLIVTDAELQRLSVGLCGSSQAQGKMALQGRFTANGSSPAGLVASLAGEGRFGATGLDAGADDQGFGLAVVLAPVRALSQLGGVFSGGVTEGFASVGAEFNGSEGKFAFSQATLESNVYSGVFSGEIDLPRWWVDARGRVNLEVNLITQLLGNRLQMPSIIPITVQGPLDLPNVTMNTGIGSQSEQTDQTQPSPEPDPQASPLRRPVDVFQGILNELTKPR